MSLPFDIPPAINRLRNSERRFYLRSSPRRRVHQLSECARANPRCWGVNDKLALAVAELKAVYGGRLPPGQYSNFLGHYFEVDRYGNVQIVQRARPLYGLFWRAGLPLQLPPAGLPLEYQFAAGAWEPFNLPDLSLEGLNLSLPAEEEETQLIFAAEEDELLRSVQTSLHQDDPSPVAHSSPR